MSIMDLRYQKQFRNRDELLNHCRNFELDLKVAVGVWYFSPGGGRFHESYVPDTTISERLEITAETAELGVRGIEAHFGPEANWENLHLYKQLEKDTGIRLIGTGPHTFYSKDYEFGALSNPISKVRDTATRALIDNLKFNKEAGVDGCGVWPGIDGYTISYGHLYYQMWENFEAALAEAMDEVPGVMVRIESKPYEPIPNNIYRTSGDALLLARDVEKRLKNPINRKLLSEGRCLVGMQPEIGHIRMAYEDTPYVFSRISREGRLAHTHWNSQPLGNYDQDLNTGAVEWDQAEAALYALKMIGYREYFGIDINPERIPIKRAIEINCRVLKIMNDRVNRLPHDKIIDCYYSPQENRGELELLIAESKA